MDKMRWFEIFVKLLGTGFSLAKIICDQQKLFLLESLMVRLSIVETMYILVFGAWAHGMERIF